MISFRKTETISELKSIETLARIIWNEHYTDIIGSAQVNYMLVKFQSISSMLDQIAQGFQYYGIYQEQDLIGYFSYQVKDGQMFLSKYYLIKEQRGLGYGRKTNEFIIQIAKQLGLSSINLTVNKLNEGSIAAYEKMGFRRRGELVMDIGGGFVMDDYRYEYPLN